MRKAISSLLFLFATHLVAQTQVDINQQVKGLLKPPNGGIGASPAGPDTTPVSTSSSIATWAALPNCPNDGGHAITYSTSSHSYGCAAVSGSGGRPAGQPQQVQFNGGSAFAASSATLDASGNFIGLSYGGTPDAILSQTNPTTGTGDGIQNALQSANSIVTVNQGYAATEGNFSSPYRIVPFEGQLPLMQQPTFHAQSGFIDYRATSTGKFFFNPPSGGSPIEFDSMFSNDGSPSPNNGAAWFPIYHMWWIAGGGRNQETSSTPGDQSVRQHMTDVMEDQSMGISSHHQVSCYKDGIGDFHCDAINMVNNGDAQTPSDEGGQDHRDQAQESNWPYFGTITGTPTLGQKVIANTPVLPGQAYPGEGRPTVFPNKALAPTLILAVTGPSNGGQTAGTWTMADSQTPDTFGRNTSLVQPQQLDFGQTTPVTVAMSSLTAAINPAHDLCIGGIDEDVLENASIASCGAATGASPNISQSCTVNLRLQHLPNAYVSQGAHACKGFDIMANDTFQQNPAFSPLRNMLRSIGRSATNTVLYSVEAFGSNEPAPWYDFSTMTLGVNGDALTRSGGQVTFSPSTEAAILYGNDCIKITTASDPTYNGSFCGISYNISTNVLSWPNAGANGSTTLTAPIALAALNGAVTNAVQEMPMYTTTSSFNPATGSPDGTVTIEANEITNNVGETVETQHGANVTLQLYHGVASGFNVPSQAATLSLIEVGWNGRTPPGQPVIRFTGNQDARHQLGAGGTQSASSAYLEDDSIVPQLNGWVRGHGLFGVNGGIAFRMIDCGIYACDNPLYSPQIFNLVGTNSTYEELWAPWNNDTHVQEVGDSSITMRDNVLILGSGNGSASSEATYQAAAIDLNINGGGTDGDFTMDFANGFRFHSALGLASHFDADSTVKNSGGTDEFICSVAGTHCLVPTFTGAGGVTVSGTWPGITITGTGGSGTHCTSSSITNPLNCGSDEAGQFVVGPGATTFTIQSTAVTAGSRIFLQFDSSLGATLGVTCDTTVPTVITHPTVRVVSGTPSFTFATSAPVTNPGCYSFTIEN